MLLLLFLCFIAVQSQQIKGDVNAVYQLLERVVPSSSAHFNLAIVDACPGTSDACFAMSDDNGKIKILGTSASELTAAIGVYFREFCNMTIGWPRGGGSNIFKPITWPSVGSVVSKQRIVPWSYMMNVCTHSYSLVWYSEEDWSNFIDWMALSGINLALALTGQEEVQYKVFSQLGLSDIQIRSWFNGPAFLAWSRGQNEYGNNITGPLPRSWMKQQWNLQKFILSRYRSLGIVGQLPAFQGNVPWPLAAILNDTRMTQQGDTGWMDSLDPVFGKIADLWMKTIIEDFGTDHWYQLDGYFNGGTAPWVDADLYSDGHPLSAQPETQETNVPYLSQDEINQRNGLPDCQFAKAENSYLAGCFLNCQEFPTVEEAMKECVKHVDCGGITVTSGKAQLRSGTTPRASPDGETSYYITNGLDCHEIVADPMWKLRGAAAYAGITRTDPDAIWSFQGWAIVHWTNVQTACRFKGFVDSVPKGRFVVIDMSVNGVGEWKNYNAASFFGAPFIWTTLHDFGGTDGMKGDLRMINNIPFEGLSNSTVWGTGYTPEGIDQNPVYYEFMAEANWRKAPVEDIPKHIVVRSHKRYGLAKEVDSVTKAWEQLVGSTYSQDLSVRDGTGVPHLPGPDTSQFYPDRVTPMPKLCLTFQAWSNFISAASEVPSHLETFRYDLINVGREILAQLSTPFSHNFADAFNQPKLDAQQLKTTGGLYVQLLKDIDSLVSTESAFLIGPWIEAARKWGAGASDCHGTKSCPDFYEWNARVQLTTWNPTRKNDTKIPSGPNDYAGKHWQGLIRDYYAARAEGILDIALNNAAQGKPLDNAAVAQFEATHAYTWTNSVSSYPTTPTGSALAASKVMYAKYAKYFSKCASL
eukprot:TRINITY_DN6809_c0_g1_i1.p1 TRINITY_DN6809_c0_g1~~TRINITY_DN6809_c0_g1_i1.p1  ORF type:complete len:867 (-),score=166.22 TRINITY_DN6809_c0_g1_i1:45-2645(-)